MIVFDLECRAGTHLFEGWFGSSEDFARQQERGLLMCPVCGSADVGKAVMAPHVGRKGNQVPISTPALSAPQPHQAPQPHMAAGVPAAGVPAAPSAAALPPEAVAMLKAVAAMQAEALKSSRWVGKGFAEDARAMHYGEKDAEIIHGQATPEEARDLIEEGIAVTPILFPVAPPGETN